MQIKKRYTLVLETDPETRKKSWAPAESDNGEFEDYNMALKAAMSRNVSEGRL
jgi:hypothetical protein